MDAKIKSKNSFNKQAPDYDTSDYSKYPRQCYPYVLEAISNIKFNRVLDLGCGTGVILKEIRNINNEAELFGLDLSENMILQAAERLGTDVGLSAGDAENMPYEDNSFDLVCCVESFHHYPNPAKALSEINRVLRKGGVLLICDTWARSPIRQIMNIFIRFSSDGDVHIYSENEINGLLAAAGFDIVSWKLITDHAYLSVSRSSKHD